MNRRFVKPVFACLCACVLCGCSSMRLTYNYLDWIIGWYLDDFLELNSRQDDFYEERLDALMEWHRREELVRYSRFIEQIQQDLREPLSAALLQERYETLKQFFRDIMEQAAPDCAELLLWLDEEQRAAFYDAAAQTQKKYEEKYLNETAQERSRRHCRQAEKALKRFVGGLNGGQKALLERWAGGLVPLQRLWLENRSAWQARLRDVLEADCAEPEKQKMLRPLFVEPEHLWAPDYRDAVAQNEAATLAMLAGLHTSLTEKQQEHLHRALERLKKDFIVLAKQ